MNEPEKLNLSDRFNAMVTVAVFLAGGFAAWVTRWITGRRAAMHKRFDAIDQAMNELKDRMAATEEQIAVTETNMDNIQRNMEDLKDATKEQTKLLHAILLQTRATNQGGIL